MIPFPYQAAGAGLLSRAAAGGGVVATPFRYWRIYITANGLDAFTSVNEMRLRSTPGSGNDAVGGTPVASSSYFSDNGARAFDGNTIDTSAWVSAQLAPPHWLGYDFGDENDKVIRQVSLWPESTNGYKRAPTAFVVQGSHDGSGWSDVASFSGITGWSSAWKDFTW